MKTINATGIKNASSLRLAAMGAILLGAWGLSVVHCQADILYATASDAIWEFTPVIGSGAFSGSVFASSGLDGAEGLAFDGAGNLYVANAPNNTIEKFTPGGVPSVFASTGLANPQGLAFDSAGNLYVANDGNNTIEKFTSGGVGSVFASSGLANPGSLAFDSAGNLYVTNNGGIEKFTPGGVGSTFASLSLGNLDISVSYPLGLAFDKAGNLYVTGGGLEEITPGGVGSFFAVQSEYSFPLGPGLAFGSDDGLYATNGYQIAGVSTGYEPDTGIFPGPGVAFVGAVASYPGPGYLAITNDAGQPLLTPAGAGTARAPGPVVPTGEGITVSAGASYANIAPLTATGGFGSTAAIIGGTASSSSLVTVAFKGTGNYANIASDVVTVSGMPEKGTGPGPLGSTLTDEFVLKLSYNSNAANEISGGPGGLALLWLDPTTATWVNAILGNSDGGAGANFVLGAYDPSTDFNLSWYGVDTTDDYVWAVLDHNSDFGAGNPDDAPITDSPVPEPSTWWAMLSAGFGMLLLFRRRGTAKILSNAISMRRNTSCIPRIPICTLVLGLLLLGIVLPASAQTWLANPASGDWNTAGNWTAGGPPDGASATATFDQSGTTAISISAPTQVDSVIFNPDASEYTITANPGSSLTISGAGIINNSSAPPFGAPNIPFFVAATNGSGSLGTIAFTGTASAGVQTVFTTSGGSLSGAGGGVVEFENSSTAGSGNIYNGGGTVSGAMGGLVSFSGSSTAATAEVTNYAGTVSGAVGGSTVFSNSSTAGTSVANSGATVSGAGAGQTTFNDTSSAGSATIFNHAGAVSGAGSGQLTFNNTATAGFATIYNYGGTVSGAAGGQITFSGTATAGDANITNSAGSVSGAFGSQTTFNGSSTMGVPAQIFNNAATVSGAGAGQTVFNATSKAGGLIINYSSSVGDAGSGQTIFNDSATAVRLIENAGGSVSGGLGGLTEFNDTSEAVGATITNSAGTTSGAYGGQTIFNDNTSTVGIALTNYGSSISGAYGGQTNFYSSSTATSGTFTNNGGSASGATGGATSFGGNSSAGNSKLIANGGTASGAYGGVITFGSQSSASSATLIANAGTHGGGGGTIVFNQSASSGAANVQVFGNGSLDISAATEGFIMLNSLAGTGNVFLGSNSLFIGPDSPDATFSGVIQDGGQSGGMGGSLAVASAGTFILTGSNTYTGITSVGEGTLQIGNGSTGSISGSSAISVVSGGSLAWNLAAGSTFSNQITNNGAANGGDEGPNIGGTTSLLGVSTAGRAVINNVAGAYAGQVGGATVFYNNSSAGNARITNAGALAAGASGGQTTFNDTSTAGLAFIFNNGGTVGGASGGQTTFNNNSKERGATIFDYAGAVSGAFGGQTTFNSTSSSPGATFYNYGGSVSSAGGGQATFNGTSYANGIIDNYGGSSSGAGAGQTTFNNTSSTGGIIFNYGGSVSGANAGQTTFNDSSYAYEIIQNMAASVGGAGAGQTIFNDTSYNEGASIVNDGGSVSGAAAGQTVFNNMSKANGGVIQNEGASASGAGAGQTIFNGNASAGTLGSYTTITNYSGSNGGAGGGTYFKGQSDGGTARLVANGNGFLDISGLTTTGMNIGSIEGSGTFYLGSKTLAVGGNNLSTTVSGVIQDGGANCGAGGSLTKAGTGTLILTGINTYTAATTVNGGTLQAAGNSLAGTSAINVNSGGNLVFTSDFTNNVPLQVAADGPGGTVTVNGNYTQSSTGSLDLELGGESPSDGVTTGGDYTHLDVTGNVTAGGTFGVSLENGFEPTLGDVFHVINYSSLTGGSNFSSYLGLRLAGTDMVLTPTFGANGMTLTAVDVASAPAQTITPGTPLAVSAGSTYAGLTATEGSGNQTTATVLDGVSGAGTNVSATFSAAGNFGAGSGGPLASDILNFHGTGTDTFVLQIGYNPALLAAGETPYLEWFDAALNGGQGGWENAVLDNTSPGNTVGPEILGAYDPTQDFLLGNYGVDTTNDVVWAVLDHNSEFAAGGLDAVPEPATWASLAISIAAAVVLSRSRRHKV